MIVWLNGTFGVVLAAATQILDYIGGVLIIPQTVLVQRYWHEISAGLETTGVPTHHFVLHAERDELVRRIQTDRSLPNSPWRLDHLADYDAAWEWHRDEGHIIDTTELEPRQIATLIATQLDIAGG